MPQTVASRQRLSKLNSCRRLNLPKLLAFPILCVVGVLPLQGQAHENWSGWSSLGQTLASDPGVAQNNDGKLEVFFRSSDNQMYHSKQVSPGSEAFDPFTNLEDGHLGNPVMIAGSDGRLWVFVRGANGVLFYKFQQGAPGGEWSAWVAFTDGALQGDPAVVVFQGRLHVFVRGTDIPSRLYYQAQTTEGNDSSWSGWISLGGVITANPAAVASDPNSRLEVLSAGATVASIPDHGQQRGRGGAQWAASAGPQLPPSRPTALSSKSLHAAATSVFPASHGASAGAGRDCSGPTWVTLRVHRIRPWQSTTITGWRYLSSAVMGTSTTTIRTLPVVPLLVSTRSVGSQGRHSCREE